MVDVGGDVERLLGVVLDQDDFVPIAQVFPGYEEVSQAVLADGRDDEDSVGILHILHESSRPTSQITDRELVSLIMKFAPDAKFKFRDERCVLADFTSDNYAYHGLVRRMNSGDKFDMLHLLSRLENLQYLDLSKNKLGDIDIPMSRELIYLDLSSNNLDHVPGWIRGLKLSFLNLGSNQIGTIPDWLGLMSTLRTLKLHKNRIRQYPKPLASLRLTELNLYMNYMKTIPPEVFDYTQLESFSWGVSGISELPDKLDQWSQMKYLTLVANKLEKLPDSFCKLSKLKGVRLHKNRLASLPCCIGDLSEIEDMTLNMNRLTSLPESFGRLKLKRLNIEKNMLGDDLPTNINGWMKS